MPKPTALTAVPTMPETPADQQQSLEERLEFVRGQLHLLSVLVANSGSGGELALEGEDLIALARWHDALYDTLAPLRKLPLNVANFVPATN